MSGVDRDRLLPQSILFFALLCTACPAAKKERTSPQKVQRKAVMTKAASPSCPPPAEHYIPALDHDQSAPFMEQHRLRRWHSLVHKIVAGEKQSFALLMTFIVIESGGRQFAVSRSGCAGLMQFCATTALRRPFSRFFHIDRMRSCACMDRRCAIHWQTRRFLETTPRRLHPIVASEFPCALDDPRFDAEASLRAGWTYLQQLQEVFEDNVYLIYIGYNSGPHAAERLWRAIGRRRARSLLHIARALPRALRPNFKRRARRRARSLVRAHLPKIARVYRAYTSFAESQPLGWRPPSRTPPSTPPAVSTPQPR